ncbi:MAG: hypothetical protein Fur003_3450 [Candidatus Dojkabacteria bacterium]
MIKPEDRNIYKPYKKLVNEAIDAFIASNNRKPILLDAGCGHSSTLEEEYTRCAKVIGVDVDKAGLDQNQWVDEKYVADLTQMPLEDNSVDIIVSEWVLEHIEKPEKFLTECARVLNNQDGFFLFITPNKWSPYSIVTRLVPNKLHGAIVKFFYKRPTADTFPTFFRMNSEKTLTKLMQEYGFVKTSLIFNDDPLYMSFWKITKPLAQLWQIILRLKFLTRVKAHIIGNYRRKML